jgi:hypothetical protein
MRFLIATTFLCIFSLAGAQKVKLINASKQEWSGGEAGHYGTNYSITIQCSDTSITPDTLWIGQNYTKLYLAHADSLLKKYDKKNKTVTFHIYTGEDHYENYNDPMSMKDTVGKKIAGKGQSKQYSGVALISYTYLNKQYSIIVKTFQELPPLSYP